MGNEKFEEIVFPELGKRFEKKLRRLVTPKPNIAVPALEAMRLIPQTSLSCGGCT